MKRFFTLGIALAAMLGTLPANAQDDSKIDLNYPCGDVYTHSWKDNWYLQLKAGAQMPFFEKTPDSKNFDIDKTTAIYSVAVGHWFSPYFGFRFDGQGGALHYDDFGWQKLKYAGLDLQLTWDMFNTLGGINSKRIFSIIPYIGLGGNYAWNFNKDTKWAVPSNKGGYRDNQFGVSATFGLEFRFRVHKNVDLFLDARAKAMPESFNNLVWDDPVEPVVSAMAGITINLGKEGRHFNTFNPCDYTNHIKDLNDRINDLRGQLDETEAKLRACESRQVEPTQPEATPAEKNVAFTPAVRFRINSAKVSANDKITLYDVAQAMKKDSSIKVVLRGYADKKTGTEAYNKKLSERRAEAVRDILVNYGADADRISTEGFGDSEQPYADENNWNRVVLIDLD